MNQIAGTMGRLEFKKIAERGFEIPGRVVDRNGAERIADGFIDVGLNGARGTVPSAQDDRVVGKCKFPRKLFLSLQIPFGPGVVVHGGEGVMMAPAVVGAGVGAKFDGKGADLVHTVPGGKTAAGEVDPEFSKTGFFDFGTELLQEGGEGLFSHLLHHGLRTVNAEIETVVDAQIVRPGKVVFQAVIRTVPERFRGDGS